MLAFFCLRFIHAPAGAIGLCNSARFTRNTLIETYTTQKPEP
ncbi:hypothetical protein C4K18_4897 [Pseudomonas chlororaphis subsp. aurantiaca]|nr:hypothetical protein C4K18_4897 [Pseudomonas chlororaphis subsp. aurantiaca]